MCVKCYILSAESVPLTIYIIIFLSDYFILISVFFVFKNTKRTKMHGVNNLNKIDCFRLAEKET